MGNFFLTRLTLLISSSILFAFFFILMLFRTSTFASFFLFCWHESFSFLFLYFLQTSSAFLLFLMFLLHQALEAQPGGKPGHRIFHAKHGLSLSHGKTSYPFLTPSISLFPETTHLPPLFTLSRLNRLPRAYLDALFQPQQAWNFFLFVKLLCILKLFNPEAWVFFAGIHFFYASYVFIYLRLRFFLLLFIFFTFAPSPLFR